MKKFHADRLRFLADHLMTMKPTKQNRFDMTCFVLKNECGTAACAFGTAAMLPRFRKAGLSTKYGMGAGTWEYFNVFNKKNGLENFEAAEEFFGLNFNECHDLFDQSGYENIKGRVTPKIVARKIYKLLKLKGY